MPTAIRIPAAICNAKPICLIASPKSNRNTQNASIRPAILNNHLPVSFNPVVTRISKRQTIKTIICQSISKSNFATKSPRQRWCLRATRTSFPIRPCRCSDESRLAYTDFCHALPVGKV